MAICQLSCLQYCEWKLNIKLLNGLSVKKNISMSFVQLLEDILKLNVYPNVDIGVLIN